MSGPQTMPPVDYWNGIRAVGLWAIGLSFLFGPFAFDGFDRFAENARPASQIPYSSL